jgi:hypothetical protein
MHSTVRPSKLGTGGDPVQPTWCWQRLFWCSLHIGAIPLAALVWSSSEAQVVSAEANTFQQLLEETSTCVDDAILRSSGVKANRPYLDVYVFDQVAKRLDAVSNRSLEHIAELTRKKNETCAEIVRSYADARAQIANNRASQRERELAPLGGLPIESTSPFFEITQNHIGIHWQGHADITLVAMQALAQKSLSDDALLLIRRASQAPDQYRWSDHRYHAHSPDWSSEKVGARQAAIDTGTAQFIALLRNRIVRIRSHINSARFESALFVMGNLSHMVQDLVYHRGMTFREHSGLAYLRMENPDFPEGELAQQRFEEAVDATVQVLRHALVPIGKQSQEPLFKWARPGGFDFSALALKEFPEGEDVGILALGSYLSLSFSYGSGQRPVDELQQNDQCSNTRGRACWLPQRILSEILAE